MKIEVKNLTKKFKERVIFNNINISFYSGNIYCLSGPSGCGKSLFLKILSGNDCPTAGDILLNGISIVHRKFIFWKRKPLVKFFKFVANLSGFDNLKSIAKKKGNITDDDILVILKKLNLFNYKDLEYSKYSYGMKRRLKIAGILMEDPQIIILDEPLHGVDQDVKEQIINILKFAASRNRIVIITTNNDLETKNLADVTYKISDGNISWA